MTAIGLTVSDAGVRAFLTRVAVDKQMPFTLKVPNAESHSAMIEGDPIARTDRAHFLGLTESVIQKAVDAGELIGVSGNA